MMISITDKNHLEIIGNITMGTFKAQIFLCHNGILPKNDRDMNDCNVDNNDNDNPDV